MNELEKVVKDVVHGSLGAVATMLEVGGEIAKTFVEKGQEVAGGIKQAVDEACEARKADPGVDVRSLTKQQRAELRRRLDELDAEEAEADQADEAAENEGAEVEINVEIEMEAEAPDVTYTTPDEANETKA